MHANDNNDDNDNDNNDDDNDDDYTDEDNDNDEVTTTTITTTTMTLITRWWWQDPSFPRTEQVMDLANHHKDKLCQALHRWWQKNLPRDLMSIQHHWTYTPISGLQTNGWGHGQWRRLFRNGMNCAVDDKRGYTTTDGLVLKYNLLHCWSMMVTKILWLVHLTCCQLQKPWKNTAFLSIIVNCWRYDFCC